MGHRQKGKGMKRKSSWHTRGNGPDKGFAIAMRKIERAIRRDKERGNGEGAL